MKQNYYFKRMLSALLLLMASSLLRAYDFEQDGIYYNVNKDKETVSVIQPSSSRYVQGYSGNIVIPSMVSYGGYIYRVTGIENYAFIDCPYLKSISIPSSVTSIGNYTFDYSPSLESITVSTDNPVYDSREGCNALIETATNKLIKGCNNTIIPDGVTSIGRYAFNGCRSLTDIYIPNSVTSIGYQTFCDCTSLTSVNIPESVTSIGDYAFTACRSLTGIYIPNSVTSIGKYAFFQCSSLIYAVVGKGVTRIEDGTFASCRNLPYIDIYGRVTSIGVGAFSGCSSLKSIGLPSSVTSIGDGAFSNCSSLNFIGIPSSVTSIGESAFRDCTSLTSINIPEGVTRIGDNAFNGCRWLTTVFCRAKAVPQGGSTIFHDVPQKQATLYVPASALEDYKATYQWKDFGTILPLEAIPTGIDSPVAMQDKAPHAPYYTLDGKPVTTLTRKGIYIKNGKKVMVK